MKLTNVALALLFAPASATLLALSGCGANPGTDTQKAELTDESQLKLKELETDSPGLKDIVDGGYGYAMFPDATKGGLVIEGGSGYGNVYQQGKYIGTAHLTLVNGGAVIGGSSFSELVVFQSKAALDDFEADKVKFDAQASATALKAGAMAQARFNNGVAVFTKSTGGLEVDASIGGQQFTFKAAQITPTVAPTLSNPQ